MRTHLDLFSGIGGFALAARWADFSTFAFCEIEDYPRRVLAKNFPGIPIHHDIRELDGKAYRGVSLITGGYPCQPFSLAGKRKGTQDDRHLWPEMLRIIAQARPSWVVAENVAGHVTMGLDQVLSDLENEGYAIRPVIIPACAVDAPHRRDREWIVAHSCSARRWENTGSAHEDKGQYERRSSPQADQPAGDGKRCATEVVADTDRDNRLRRSSTMQMGRERIKGKTALYGDAARTQWPTEPAVGRVANGVPKRVDRLKGLGNAIVPQIAYEILRHLA